MKHHSLYLKKGNEVVLGLNRIWLLIVDSSYHFFANYINFEKIPYFHFSTIFRSSPQPFIVHILSLFSKFTIVFN